MKKFAQHPIATLCGILILCRPAIGLSAEAVPDMSLEELVNLDVVSASRKTQSLQQVAAAVFVITQEDIARSGARSLADVLAMAPGVEVARIGNNRWAVSARGSNGRFANKLQVLKDGRSLYSPLYSGVFWESEDMVLEDIERIEVIRGPNAVMWGSNAVNGTINIITRKARDTQGGLVSASTGSEDKGNVAARYGTTLGDNGYMRVYGKSVDRRGSFNADGSRAVDNGDSGMIGFRSDWLISSGNRVSLNAEAYHDRNMDRYNFADPLRPATNYLYSFNSALHLSGGHVQGNFESLRDDGAEIAFQSYLTHSVVDADQVIRETRDTLDIDAQYRFAPHGDHDLIAGMNLRTSTDSVTAASKYVNFFPADKVFHLASVFVNDDVTIVPERLRITVGARLEYNNFGGTALQPTTRFLWTPNERQTVWGALSRATRTPSRAEEDVSIGILVTPPAPPFVPLPVLTSFNGNASARPRPEILDAAELGYRHRFGANLSLDATAFAHRLKDGITTVSSGTATFNPNFYLDSSLTNINGEKVRVNGVELALFVQASPSWRLQPSYTWMAATANGLGDVSSEAYAQRSVNSIPRHQLSLRSQHNLDPTRQLDFWLKYKSDFRASTATSSVDIPRCANLDIRYAWKASRTLEVSLVGQNLLHRQVLGYTSSQLPSIPVETGRGAYLRAEYRF